MFRWMSRVMREGRIRNEYVKRSKCVASIMDKMRENKLRLFEHVMRREKSEAILPSLYTRPYAVKCLIS